MWQAKTQTRCHKPGNQNRARRDSDRFFISDSAHFDSYFNEIEPHLEIAPNADLGLFKVKGIKLKGAENSTPPKPRKENPKVMRRLAAREARKVRRNQAISRNGPSSTGYQYNYKNER